MVVPHVTLSRRSTSPAVSPTRWRALWEATAPEAGVFIATVQAQALNGLTAAAGRVQVRNVTTGAVTGEKAFTGLASRLELDEVAVNTGDLVEIQARPEVDGAQVFIEFASGLVLDESLIVPDPSPVTFSFTSMAAGELIVGNDFNMIVELASGSLDAPGGGIDVALEWRTPDGSNPMGGVAQGDGWYRRYLENATGPLPEVVTFDEPELVFNVAGTHEWRFVATNSLGEFYSFLYIRQVQDPGGDTTPPSIPAGQEFNVPDTTLNGSYLGTVVATDNVGVTFLDITAGNTGGAFTLLDNGQLYLNSQSALIANGPTFVLTATARDAGGNETTEDFTVTVTTAPVGYYGPDYRPAAPTPIRTVAATTGSFAAAIADAQPGDRIELATGSYGSWDIDGATLAGTAANPIVVTPAAGATVTFTEIDIRENCRHLWLGQFFGDPQHTQFVVDHGGTGGACLRIGWDQQRSGSFAQNTVDNIKACGIHFTNVGFNHIVVKGGATDVEIINNRFTEAGKIEPDTAENIYIGQANGSGNPSPNERILIQGNIFENATADTIDIKLSNIQDIQVLDNYLEIAVFDGTAVRFTNAAIGVTQVQSVQVRDPEIKILRNVIRDITETGTQARARGITTWGPAEIAYNIIYNTQRESMRIKQDASLPSWWTTAVKFDIHHNTCFAHGGGYSNVFFEAFDTADAARLRFVSNVTEGAVSLPSGTGEASDNHSAASSDFVGPLNGDADAGSHVGSGYQLASSSSIPATAGALGKSGTAPPASPVTVVGSGPLAYNSQTTFILPAGIAASDVLIVFGSEAGSGDPGAMTASIPAGSLSQILSDKPQSGNFQPRQTQLGRVLAASDAGVTCTVVPGTLAESIGWAVLRGLTGLPGSKVQVSGGSPDGIQFGEVTGLAVNELMIFHGSAQSASHSPGDASSLDIDVIELFDQLANNRGNWAAIHVATAGGTVTPGTLSADGGGTYDNWVGTITRVTTS